MMGSDGYTMQGGINKLIRDGITISSRTIGPPTITGSGLDDFSNGGEFTGDSDVEYELEIVTAGTPDAFQLSRNGVVITASIPIDGSNQDLGLGVTGKFDATTGHDLGDIWTFTARAADPTSVQKLFDEIISVSFIGAGDIESDPVDLRNVESATLTISGDFDIAAVLGMTVEIFSSPDGINWDTDPWASTGLEPTVTPSSTSQKTSNLDAIPRYIKVKITNNDALALGNTFARLVKLEV